MHQHLLLLAACRGFYHSAANTNCVPQQMSARKKLNFYVPHSSKMVDIFEDTYYTNTCLDDDEKHFHSIIGHIEDILMGTEFLNIQTAFMEKYWKEFEDTDENKLSYTEIFNEYIETIEKYIENELTYRVPNFTMQEFEAELKDRQKDLDGEIFEILSTFSDFCAFKTMFIDYKNMKEGKTIDFSSDLCISKYNTIEGNEDSFEEEP